MISNKLIKTIVRLTTLSFLSLAYGCELGNNGLQFSKKRALLTCLQICDTSQHNPSMYSVDGCNRCAGMNP